ncbi:MAG: hypothetical protein WAV90_26115 [Gordonia amarae]
MFEEFTGKAHVPAITFEAVKLATGLDWFEVTSKDQLPKAPGVYCWVDPETDLVHYHGAGEGASGLWTRLGNQLRFRTYQRDRIAAAETEDDMFWVLAESPAIRMAAETNVHPWAAVAREPEWRLDDVDDDALPSSARGWESFIYECSHLVAGRRSLLGGGAWESKHGSLGSVMENVAWSRLRNIHDK